MKTKKSSLSLILAMLLVFAFAMSASAAPTQNDDGFYELATADDMVWFRDQVAAGNTTINAVLMADIDLSKIVWQPIWNESLYDAEDPGEFNFATSDSDDLPYWYGGTFDGNGKILKIDTYNNSTYAFPANPLSPQYPYPIQAGGGIFMGISDVAVIKNFVVTGKMTLAGFPSVADVRVFAAPVVAKNRGTVYNVTVKDFSIENNGQSATSTLGAIACLSYGDKTILDGCSVVNTNIYSTSLNPIIGLLTAHLRYAATARNCTVSDSTVQNSGGGYAGGIVGNGAYGASIVNCIVSNIDLNISANAASGFNEAITLYIGGIAASLTGAMDDILPGILNCSVTDSVLTAKTADDFTYSSAVRAGGIVGRIQGEGAIGAALLQNCVTSNVTLSTSASHTNYSGAIAGISSYAQVMQCYAEDSTLSLLHNGSYATAGNISTGGIVGNMANLANTTEYKGKLFECAVNGLSIDAESTNSAASVTYAVGGIAGDYSTLNGISGNHLLQNCVVAGDVVFDVATNNGRNSGNAANIGGLVGRSYAKAHENVLGNFSVTSDDVAGTTTWRIGILAGQLVGRNATNLRGELVDNLYDENISLAKLVVYPTNPNADPNHATATDYVSGNETFDGSGLENEATLFVTFLKGGEVELSAGQTLDLALEAFAGTAGIDLSAATWTSSDPSVLSVSPATGANVTISALAPGTATLTCTYTLNGEEKTSTLTIVVPETPEYAKDGVTPDVSGTPEDGTIFPGEDVNLTYDFSPYIAIGVDDSGMQTDISGLIADILDGKVVVTGVAKESGTYYYDVTLLGANGEVRTQRVLVTVQGGSRPTGNGGGGGSSHCNAGLSASALLSLLGLALVLKRK